MVSLLPVASPIVISIEQGDADNSASATTCRGIRILSSSTANSVYLVMSVLRDPEYQVSVQDDLIVVPDWRKRKAFAITDAELTFMTEQTPGMSSSSSDSF
jgi:hypothetical protein